MLSEIKGEIRFPRSGSKTMTTMLRASQLREHPGSRLGAGGRGQRLEQDPGAGRLRIPLENRNNIPGSLLQEAGEGIPTWTTSWAGEVWSSIAGYDLPCLLLPGPLTCQAPAFKKPNEQTSLFCSCSAPWLFPSSGNACDMDPVLFTTSRRVGRRKKRSLL